LGLKARPKIFTKAVVKWKSPSQDINSMSDTFDYRLSPNSAIILAGSTSSGKSTLCLELIKRRREVFTTPIDAVIYVYQTYQDNFSEFETDDLVTFVSDYRLVDTELAKNADLRHLVVFDDQIILFEQSKEFSSFVEEFFIFRSTHSSYTPILIVHSLFPPKLRLCSLNCKCFIIYKNIRDVSQTLVLGTQMGVGSLLKRALDYITASNNYGFLVCDLSRECPERFRFRNFIWPVQSEMCVFTV